MAKGEQIYIFYGERSNADFLVYNGFVYPENYHDAIKVKFGISNSNSYMPRLALLRKLKLPASGEYLIRADKTNPIHPSVLAFVRIFKMNEGKLELHFCALNNFLSYSTETLLSVESSRVPKPSKIWLWGLKMLLQASTSGLWFQLRSLLAKFLKKHVF